MPESKPAESSWKVPSYITETGIGLFLLLLAFSFIFKISFLDLLKQIQISYAFYTIHPVITGTIKGIPVHILVYSAALILAVILSFKRVLILSRRKEVRASFYLYYASLLLKTTWILWFLLVTIQMINDTNTFRSDAKELTSFSVQEMHSRRHDHPYVWATRFKEALPGRHRCEFRTDTDLTRDPYMRQHRTLAYFLFPDIDIRGVYDEQPVECLVLYGKANAPQAVPPEFKIVGPYSSSTLLAIRKGLNTSP